MLLPQLFPGKALVLIATNQENVFLLAEKNPAGHRLAYVRLLAEEALRRSNGVHIVLPPQAPASIEFETHLAHLRGQVELHIMEDFSFINLVALSKRLGATRTVVTDGDALALQVVKRGGWFGAGRLSLLIMREFAQGESSRAKLWVKNWAKRFVYRCAASCRSVDLAVLKSALWAGKSSFRVALDPAWLSCTSLDVEDIRSKWELDDSIYWFAVLGAITDRKNVPLVVQSLASLPGANIGLVVAGKIDPSVRKAIYESALLMSTGGKTAKVFDGVLTDTDLDAAVSAVDCLVLAHSNEGPSGLLAKAAIAGTNIVAAGATSLQEDVVAFGEAAQWCPLQSDSLAQALSNAMAMGQRSVSRSGTTSSFLDALLPE